jgi:hypothetical protein
MADYPDLSCFDFSNLPEPDDGIIYLYQSTIDGFWHITVDEDIAIQEATGYPPWELREDMKGSHLQEKGTLIAIYIDSNKTPSKDKTRLQPLAETCSLCDRGYHPNLAIDIADEPVNGEHRWRHKQCKRDHDRAFAEAFIQNENQH